MLNLQTTSTGKGGVRNPGNGWEKYGRWIVAGVIGLLFNSRPAVTWKAGA